MGTSAYNAAIAACGHKGGSAEAALPLLREMKRRGVARSVITYRWVRLASPTRYHTVPCLIMPYYTLSIPYTIPYNIIPYNTIPYNTIPYHTIPYHTIPYGTEGVGAKCHHVQVDTLQYAILSQATLHRLVCSLSGSEHIRQLHYPRGNIRPIGDTCHGKSAPFFSEAPHSRIPTFLYIYF